VNKVDGNGAQFICPCICPEIMISNNTLILRPSTTFKPFASIKPINIPIPIPPPVTPPTIPITITPQEGYDYGTSELTLPDPADLDNGSIAVPDATSSSKPMIEPITTGSSSEGITIDNKPMESGSTKNERKIKKGSKERIEKEIENLKQQKRDAGSKKEKKDIQRQIDHKRNKLSKSEPHGIYYSLIIGQILAIVKVCFSHEARLKESRAQREKYTSFGLSLLIPECRRPWL
jgi:hypothetical protein